MFSQCKFNALRFNKILINESEIGTFSIFFVLATKRIKHFKTTIWLQSFLNNFKNKQKKAEKLKL